MVDELTQRGYFSVLRWCSDVTRDEARNVAVIVVDSEGQFGGVRAAPISSVSPRLRERGILDAILSGLIRQFEGDAKPTLGDLRRMQTSLTRSLYLTEPRPVMVSDPDTVLTALYRAYVSPRLAVSKALTKGKVLDGVMDVLRRRHVEAYRHRYISDFVFDVIIEGPERNVAEVMSFASSKQDWMPVEHDAGHFLYALERTGIQGLAIIQPPTEASHENASRSFERVSGWLSRESVPWIEPGQLATATLPLTN
jgi:hypothetical protein